MQQLQHKNICLLLILASIVFFTTCTKNKHAFIQSEVLFSKYLGMQEAQQAFVQKQQQWQANLDTLQADYQNQSAKGADPQMLQSLRSNIQRYRDNIQRLEAEEDQKLTQAVLDQINSFITEYCEAQDYDIVFGTSGNGTILYGKDVYDITDEVLEALNQHYRPIPNAE